MHVGPHVLSAPNRTPGLVASETTTLHTLTEGRYELGLGTGRPGADRDAAAFGMPFGSAGERIAALEATVAAVRQQSPDTKVMVAAGGPKMLRSAGRMADIVTFGLPPTAGRDALAAAVDAVHEGAGQRFDDIELAQNLLVVGDEAPPWTLKWAGTDLPSLQATGSVALLSGTPEEMAEVLRRRRDELSISYLSTSLPFADALAPVVQILAGS